jgi:hypothetical protein
MRDSGDIEPQCIAAINLDQRRPPAGPASEHLHQRRIAVRVGKHRNQLRVERLGIGHSRTRPCAALSSGLRYSMDDRSVRPLDGQDDWCSSASRGRGVRRAIGGPRPPFDRQPR